MEVIPAIDVLGGRAVRLRQGRYDDVTVYAEDAISVVDWFAGSGAQRIHVVDLEAARGGTRQAPICRRISESALDVQIGGGVRTAVVARSVIDHGADRVVVGSALVSGGSTAKAIVEEVGPAAVVAALDVRDGRARGNGWLDDGIELGEAAARVADLGIASVLATGIERDGTMLGPDLAVLDRVRALLPEVVLIASGGVGSLDDLEHLAASGLVDAVVIGRALYEGAFALEDAIARAVA